MQWGLIIKKLLLLLLLSIVSLHASDLDRKPEESVAYESNLTFRDFSWGASQEEFIKKMGNPVHRDKINDLESLVWENIEVNGYMTYMLAYFSKSGLQGGTYYFLTYDMDELMRCYTEMQSGLRDRFGPTYLFNGIIRELRPYESFWDLSGGCIHLKVNTRQGEPVMLWFSSPELSRQIFGERKPVTAKK